MTNPTLRIAAMSIVMVFTLGCQSPRGYDEASNTQASSRNSSGGGGSSYPDGHNSSYGPRYIDPAALGYARSPYQQCSQIYTVLFEPNRQLCLIAVDGCVLSWAMDQQGFVPDGGHQCN